ncbi:MAG: hypothetical protein WD557_03600 [Dehalococcoidia bacterium]
MNPEEPASEEAAAEALREAAGDFVAAPGAIKEPRENPLIGWARAIALGIRDTAQDVLDEGRQGARNKQSQMWSKFDSKTKHRRG